MRSTKRSDRAATEPPSGSADAGRAVIEDTVHRLFVEGVMARDLQAYVDGTYHDDVVIHEAPSLPYGGDYHGMRGVVDHAHAFIRTWDQFQGTDFRDLKPRIVATDSEAFVLWTLSAQREGDDAPSRFPAISHYRFRGDRIVESWMYLFDAPAILAFLAGSGAGRQSPGKEGHATAGGDLRAAPTTTDGDVVPDPRLLG